MYQLQLHSYVHTYKTNHFSNASTQTIGESKKAAIFFLLPLRSVTEGIDHAPDLEVVLYGYFLTLSCSLTLWNSHLMTTLAKSTASRRCSSVAWAGRNSMWGGHRRRHKSWIVTYIFIEYQWSNIRSTLKHTYEYVYTYVHTVRSCRYRLCTVELGSWSQTLFTRSNLVLTLKLAWYSQTCLVCILKGRENKHYQKSFSCISGLVRTYSWKVAKSSLFCPASWKQGVGR